MEKIDDNLKNEGDVNVSPLRKAWQDEHIGPETAGILAEDEKYFLKQSLSTPCMNALKSAKGAWIEDIQGRR